MHALRFQIHCAMAICLAGLASIATAQDAATLNLRSLAATCGNCHGTDGRAIAGSAVVSLAGVSKEYLQTQMKAFKSGTRPATVMHQISKGYSDAQIESLAAYFAAVKP